MIHKTAKVHKTAVIYDNVTIGANTHVGALAVIGGPAESKDHWQNEEYSVHIGDNCFIGEHVTIHRGTIAHTLIGNNVWLLAHAHIGHDALICDHSTVSCHASIGGHTIILPYANIGLNAVVHQGHLVGPLAFIGQGGVVPRKIKIEPFNIYVGNPVKFLKVNKVGVDRSKLSASELENLRNIYDRISATKE